MDIKQYWSDLKKFDPIAYRVELNKRNEIKRRKAQWLRDSEQLDLDLIK